MGEDRLRQVDLLGHMDGRRRELDVALGVVELDPDVARGLLDAAELVDEVHVPGRASELAVGGRLQADVALHLDDLADRLILGRPQLIERQLARRVLVAGRQQTGGAQQAADVIGAKWRRRATSGIGALDCGHASPRFDRGAGLHLSRLRRGG